MHGSAPQDSESTPQPSGPFRTRGSVAGGQAEEALPGTRPACEDPNPVWECTSSSIGEDAVEAQDGATSEKATFSEPTTSSGAEILGLD